MEYIKIKPGDDVIRLEFVMSADEMKAVYNLLIEQHKDMITYKKVAKRMEKQLKTLEK